MERATCFSGKARYFHQGVVARLVVSKPAASQPVWSATVSELGRDYH